jgi:hypothetical protein
MKTLTCREMGGMCDEPISAETYDQMIANGMIHIEAAHPEMAASIKSMSKDDPLMVKWEEDFKKTWEAAPNK